MRNARAHKLQWPYCSFLYCAYTNSRTYKTLCFCRSLIQKCSERSNEYNNLNSFKFQRFQFFIHTIHHIDELPTTFVLNVKIEQKSPIKTGQ